MNEAGVEGGKEEVQVYDPVDSHTAVRGNSYFITNFNSDNAMQLF